MAVTTFPTRSDARNTATAGKDYLIYLNTGESDLKPTWTLLGGQRSGDLTREADEIDASSKTTGGWSSTLPGLRSWSLDLESVYLTGDEGAQFLEAAFLAGKQVHIKFEYADGRYVTGWGSITECSLSTAHDDVATISGTINGDGPLSDLTDPDEETGDGGDGDGDGTGDDGGDGNEGSGGTGDDGNDGDGTGNDGDGGEGTGDDGNDGDGTGDDGDGNDSGNTEPDDGDKK